MEHLWFVHEQLRDEVGEPPDYFAQKRLKGEVFCLCPRFLTTVVFLAQVNNPGLMFP